MPTQNVEAQLKIRRPAGIDDLREEDFIDETAQQALVDILAKIIAAPSTEGKQDTQITKLEAIRSLLSAALTVAVNNFPAVQTVAVNNLPGTQPVSAASLPLPTGASTAAKQDTAQTTLSSILTELSEKLEAGQNVGSDLRVAGAAVTGVNPVPVNGTVAVSNPTTSPETGLAKEATLLSVLSSVDGLEGFTDGIEGSLTTLNGKDFATQTTLAAILTAINAQADQTETQPISAALLPLPAGASTSVKQDTLIGHVDGLEGLLTTIRDNTDGLEATLTNVDINTDDIEAQLTSIFTELLEKLQAGDITGLATSAKQDVGNTSLASVDTKTPALDSDGNVPVTLSGELLFREHNGTFVTQRDVDGRAEVIETRQGASVRQTMTITRDGNNRFLSAVVS